MNPNLIIVIGAIALLATLIFAHIGWRRAEDLRQLIAFSPRVCAECFGIESEHMIYEVALPENLDYPGQPSEHLRVRHTDHSFMPAYLVYIPEDRALLEEVFK